MKIKPFTYTPQRRSRIRQGQAILLALIALFSIAGASINEGDSDMFLRIEAEQGELNGASVHRRQDGYSGDGYVGEFRNDGDYVTVSFEVPEGGAYRLGIGYYLPTDSGHKINTIQVNGTFYASQQFEAGDEFQYADIGLIGLNSGENTLTFIKSENDWGWMYVDYFTVTQSDDDGFSYETTETLIDKDATPETVKLYEYLRSVYGQKVLSGQQLYFSPEDEITYIENLTGEKPAMKGYDFINQTPGGDIDDQVRRGIRWVEDEGGILTMCWHWWAPKDGRAFYTADTNFDVKAAVTPGTEEYDLIIRDIDIISDLLLDMQERGIPVIWRPLHEASGGWFWWGSEGPEVYKQLWDILYDRMVHVNGVHNLIWTVNAQHPDWYVGDEKADIIGEDIYPGEHVYAAHVAKFEEAYNTVGGSKIVALTENGALPDIDEMKQTGAMWAWFMPWWGEFTTSEKHTEAEVYKAVYAHEDVLTLADLPDDLYPERESVPPEVPEDAEVRSTEELVTAMQPGWNLGNTFDSPNDETSWGNPVVTRELITAIREQGFNSIRIPVTWNNLTGEGPEHVIDPSYLARVREVVNWSLEDGFIVMINMHHDSEWLRDLPNNEQLLERFGKIWEQIAAEFKDYPDALIFEAINEPRFSENWEAADEPFLAAAESLNQTAYDIIRSSGGYNGERKIVFETLTAGISQTKLNRLHAHIKQLDDPNLIASVHYYGMWAFSVNVAGRTTFDTDVQEDIDRQLGLVHDTLTADGIPVILGEYGLLGFDVSTSVIQHGEILKFFDYIVHRSQALGIATMLWDNGQHFEREELVWRDPSLHAAIMAALNGRSSQTELDTVYLFEGELEDARMPLVLNGNTLVDVTFEGESLEEGRDYVLEDETLILKQAFVEQATGGQMGLGTKVLLHFDYGPEWELTIAVVGEVELRPLDVTTYELLMPVRYSADRVNRVKAVDENGRSVGAQTWTPYLSMNEEYEPDYSHNILRISAALLTAFGDGDIYLTAEMWSGREYPYVLTLDGRSKIGVPGTVPARLLGEPGEIEEPEETEFETELTEEPSETRGAETEQLSETETTATATAAAGTDGSTDGEEAGDNRAAGILAGLAAAAAAGAAVFGIARWRDKRRKKGK